MFLGVMGGFVVVPLNALLQYHAQNNQLGRVLASNNLIQFSVMLLFLVTTTLFSYYQFGSTGILTGLAFIAFIGTLMPYLKSQSLYYDLLLQGFSLQDTA